MSSSVIARHLIIRGAVQRVGFRASMGAEAERLGITGWVRNRSDGCVEALVQGPDGAVAQIVAWARRGPALARVTAVDVAEAVAGPWASFERRPTG
jgi:acylphosphatase